MNRAFALLAACGITAATFFATSPAAAQDRASFVRSCAAITVGDDIVPAAIARSVETMARNSNKH